MREDIVRWDKKFAAKSLNDRPKPDDFLFNHPALPDTGKALDIASGSGQNAVYLATLGLQVTAIDGSKNGMKLAIALAKSCAVDVTPIIEDLDDYQPQGQFDLIICFHYLNRKLFKLLPGLLAPGGILMMKTFNQDFLKTRPGFNPDYVLQPGELLRVFSDLTIIEHFESPEFAVGKSLLVAQKI